MTKSISYYIQLATREVNDGASLEDIISLLTAENASSNQAAFVLSEVFSIKIGEARTMLSESSSWKGVENEIDITDTFLE